MAVNPGDSMTTEQRIAVKKRTLKTLQTDDGVIRLELAIDAVFEAFEAGRASRDAEVAELRAGLEKAQANYQFMVERACDEKLDGYRELGTRLATSEQARDSLRAQLAEKDAELARLKAIQPEFDRLRELEKACLLELGTRDPGVIRDYAQELSRHRYARGPFAKGPANAQ